MAPAVVETIAQLPIPSKANVASPLRPTGALDAFESFDVTPTIGREFPRANLVDILNAPNSDDLIRELAITSKSTLISHPCWG